MAEDVINKIAIDFLRKQNNITPIRIPILVDERA